jgi:hypothetical protein
MQSPMPTILPWLGVYVVIILVIVLTFRYNAADTCSVLAGVMACLTLFLRSNSGQMTHGVQG